MPNAKPQPLVYEPGDPRAERLKGLIAERALMRGSFVLASGRTSDILFQLRQITLLPEGQFLVGSLIAEFMRRERIGCAGGLEMGAVPIVTAIAFASHLQGAPVDVFFVRKAAKEHGAKERINGYLPEGAEVLAIDDVTTTGGSTLKAVDTIVTERRAEVRFALSIVDREEGAAEAFAARGITLVSLFRKSDFLPG